MLFNSIHFLIFFPIVTLLYFLLPHRIRYIWLLISSYCFYMAWNPKYALLIATSTVITYMSGLLLFRSNQVKNEKRRIFQKKLWVILSFSSNLAILFFFKYFDFAIINVNHALSHLGLRTIEPAFDVLLPVGISFYTFQALSYTMDVYRGEIYAERNLARYALFVSFFPQLVAGPIERSKNLLVQINEKHYFNYDNVKNGLLLMLWGYFQKMVVADHIAIYVNDIFNNYQNVNGVQLSVATILFAFQIYCDFSGYSGIAKGAAKIMGFRLMENFRQPYFATSIQDFWRRWHISLSTWFRDYLYIPLGGSRCSKQNKYRNIIITFLISGLWHGASWNFVIWGGLHGMYQVIGDITQTYRNRLYKKLYIRTDVFSFKLGKIFMTFILTTFAWIFFRAPGTSAAFYILKRIFFDFSLFGLLRGFLEINKIALMSIVLLLAGDIMWNNFDVLKKLAQQNILFRWIIYFLMVLLILVFGIYGTDYVQTQFIYFQF